MRQRPDDVAAQTMLAQVRLDQGRPHAAERSLRAALRLQPDHGPALLLLGRLLQGAGRHAEGVAVLDPLARRAGGAAAWLALGVSQRALGRLQAALDSLGRAVASGGGVLALVERGNVLHDLGQAAAALDAFSAAVAEDAGLAAAHLGLGVSANILGRFGLAEAHLTEALRLRPGWVEALTSRGDTWRALGRLDLAEADLQTALRLRPGHADACVNLAFTLLQAGRFAEGWRLHEARWDAAGWRHRAQPVGGERWRGERLGGRTLLLHAEQGLGDTIQFCRLAALVPRDGGQVVLRVQAPLVGLLAGLAGVDAVVGDDAVVPRFDVRCPLMSLPHVLGLSDMPRGGPYLAADPGRVAAAARWLAGLPGLRVGLVWAGDPAMAADGRRSIALGRLAPLGQVPGVSFVGLQRGVAAGQMGQAGFAVQDAGAWMSGFEGTAALVAGLDLVIAVDTAVAHLAGALGRPVWLLNRFDTCWRWGSVGRESGWYPSMRVFRQAAPGDWDGVVGEVCGALRGVSSAQGLHPHPGPLPQAGEGEGVGLL